MRPPRDESPCDCSTPCQHAVHDGLNTGRDLDGHPLLPLEELLELSQAFCVDLLEESPAGKRYAQTVEPGPDRIQAGRNFKRLLKIKSIT